MNTKAKQAVQTSPDVIAAFDIGSNSIKMTLGRRAPNGVDELATRSETVRLGQGVDATGMLAADRMDAALKALRPFSAFARKQGAGRLIGVATEATRAARNGQAFLDRVTAETGIELTAISGDREAELTFRGLDGVVDLSGSVLVADIGGGSTEIVLARDQQVRYSKSLPIGSGRLTERFVAHDPPLAEELKLAQDSAAGILAGVPIDRAARPRLYITGGTGEYSFRMIPAGEHAGAETFDRLLQELEQTSSDDLAARLSIPVARAKVLPAGVAVARALIELADPSVIAAAQSGIRRGLLLVAFAGTL